MSDTVSSMVAGDQLRAFIERIERMDEELKAINDDKREIYAEAKGNGFDTKVIKKIVQIRRQDPAERMEQEALLELYMVALGMQAAPRYDDQEDTDDERGGFQDLVARARAPARAHVENAEESRADTNPQGIVAGSMPALVMTTKPAGGATPAVGRPNSPAAIAGDTAEASTDAAPSVVAIQPNHVSDLPKMVEAGQGGTVHPFVPRPHDGPYSSTGLKRRNGCLHVDNCAGSAKTLCFTCGHAASAGQDGSATE